MRKLIIDGAKWKWQLAQASRLLILRNPCDRKITVPLNDAFPGSMEYDIYELGWGLVIPITPRMVADYIKSMIGA